MVAGSPEDIAVSGADTLFNTLSRMLGQGLKYIPVIDDDGRLAGQVALGDIEAATAETEV